MRKTIILICLLFLCLSITGCMAQNAFDDMMNSVDPDGNDPVLDANGKPEIVLSETKVEQKNRYDRDGNHVGYYRYTYGTNCGNEGIVLIEFTDLEGNALKSYSPTLAGGTLVAGQSGETTHGHFEITQIREDVSGDSENSNYYLIAPYGDGRLCAHITARAGQAARCDLYGMAGGQVVATVTATDLKNRLEVTCFPGADPENLFDYFFEVVEGYSTKDFYFCTTRELYYDMSGALIVQKESFYSETDAIKVVRCELKDASGTVLRAYNTTGGDFELYVYYDEILRIYRASERSFDFETGQEDFTFEEYFDPARNLVIYREDYIYADGYFSHREYTVYGGKVVQTDPSPVGCKKLEFYDAKGVLLETEEAGDGQYLSLAIMDGTLEILIHVKDADGNLLDTFYYNP